jgi:hypothetical protein
MFCASMLHLTDDSSPVVSGGECNRATAVGTKRRHRAGGVGIVVEEPVHDGSDMAPMVLKASSTFLMIVA